MVGILNCNEVIYNTQIGEAKVKEQNFLPQYKKIFKEIKNAIDIDKSGYNAYVIAEMKDDIIEFIKTIYKNKGKPKDICYAAYGNEKEPKSIKLDSGKGTELKKYVEDIKDMYVEVIYEFYNDNSNKEKIEIIDNLEKKKNNLVGILIENAKKEGFEIKSTETGFNFIPIIGEGLMTEGQYELLTSEAKDEILFKLKNLKFQAQMLIENLKGMENDQIEKLKELLSIHFKNELKHKKTFYLEKFNDNIEAKQYILEMFRNIEQEVIDNYKISYEEDEEKISEIVGRYYVNIIVDNSDNENPNVIFEDDPSLENLIGTIEYENRNGNYYTDTNLIKAGALIKANEGCLVLKMNSLLMHPNSYYYLKKALLNDKVSFNYNKGYLELISLNGINPEPIDIKEKVIIIGDILTYDYLYNFDEDFRKIFKIRIQFDEEQNVNEETINSISDFLDNYSKINDINKIENCCKKEVIKYLSRKIENRNKVLFDLETIKTIVTLSNNVAKEKNKENIDDEDVRDVVYKKDSLQLDIEKMYSDKKILFNISNRKIGQINGLSVVDTGYISFGRPLKITCTVFKGSGDIIDIQKECNMSGNIHSKSIAILKGFINYLIGDYGKLPVDFHLCFEQLYGKIEGDSATVAEAVCLLSAISKIPIRQDIAVTGSINQFGEVQPIGGINEKIEGFFYVCKAMDKVDGKGVLMPLINKNNIVLNKEVEDAIKERKFTLYTMENFQDAIEVLMGDNKIDYKKIIEASKYELKRYNGKR